MSKMEEDQRKRVEDEESVIFHRKLPHKDHVKNNKTCKLCNHCREKKSDRHDTHCPIYCDKNGKDILDVDSACDDFEPKM
jgi:hypothetical protein